MARVLVSSIYGFGNNELPFIVVVKEMHSRAWRPLRPRCSVAHLFQPLAPNHTPLSPLFSALSPSHTLSLLLILERVRHLPPALSKWPASTDPPTCSLLTSHSRTRPPSHPPNTHSFSPAADCPQSLSSPRSHVRRQHSDPLPRFHPIFSAIVLLQRDGSAPSTGTVHGLLLSATDPLLLSSSRASLASPVLGSPYSLRNLSGLASSPRQRGQRRLVLLASALDAPLPPPLFLPPTSPSPPKAQRAPNAIQIARSLPWR